LCIRSRNHRRRSPFTGYAGADSELSDERYASVQNLETMSESLGSGTREAERPSVGGYELIGTERCPHQSGRIVLGRVDQDMTDFVGEHASEHPS
jgi:hypothetical protein